MAHRTIRGRVAYISEAEQTREHQFGREWFALTQHDDGQVTLRAQCEIDAGIVRRRSVIRDVTYTMDAQHRPLDCYVRLRRNGQYLGAGFFRFAGNTAHGFSHNVETGEVHQRLDLDGPIPSIAAHPLVCDMLHCLAFDMSRKDQMQRSRNIVMTSRELDGCSGPLLTPMDMDIQYLGKETITVPAGTFETEHFVFPFPDKLYPEEHIWFVRDELLLVRVRVGEGLTTRYDLVEVQREQHG
jgi:hypothetical protein